MLKSSRLILTLIKKDILLEFRQQYSFYGVLLYVASTIFVLYLAMGQPENMVWNGLFWMMQLFICVNAVAKTFLQEGKRQTIIFLFLMQPRTFYPGQNGFQCSPDVADESDKPLNFFNFTWLPAFTSISFSCDFMFWSLQYQSDF